MPTTQPSHRTALTALACLLLGSAVGWAVAQLGQRPAIQVHAAGPTPVLPPAAHEQRPERAAPGFTEAVTPRIEIPDDTPELAAASASDGAEPKPEVAPELREELAAFLKSGRFEELLVESEEDLGRFLVYQYLQANDPRRAMALLERFPAEEADLYGSVAEGLLESGDRAGAAAMFLEAIERDPLDVNWIGQMRHIDPAAALAALDAQIASAELGDDPLVAAQRASLLAAVGRPEEAKALLADVLSKGVADEWTLQTLVEVDPEWAERELRARLETDAGNACAVRLADLLAKTGRGEEGATMMESLLESDPGNTDALQWLLSVAPERAFERVQSGAVEGVDPWILSQAGARLEAQGRESEAVDLWLRAAQQDLSDGGAIEGLLRRAPEQLWEHCRTITADTRDDELLGDVADLYWQQGRHDEALDLWRRARRLDPGDGEWREKLRAAGRGQDPL
jgi:tetratricopeptide (TPR) repeat protein